MASTTVGDQIAAPDRMGSGAIGRFNPPLEMACSPHLSTELIGLYGAVLGL